MKPRPTGFFWSTAPCTSSHGVAQGWHNPSQGIAQLLSKTYFLQKSNIVNFQGNSQGFKSTSAPVNGNYPKIILDEVAIEGLDGITIPILKYRLKKRKDYTNFDPEFSTDFLIGVLKELTSRNVITAFKLPDPRPDGKLPLERKCEDDDKTMICGK